MAGTRRQDRTSKDLIARVEGRFGTILTDPPWQFTNRTGKMAPEHNRLRGQVTAHPDHFTSNQTPRNNINN
jgi:hypothetical protein